MCIYIYVCVYIYIYIWGGSFGGMYKATIFNEAMSNRLFFSRTNWVCTGLMT